jgi:hypothetical protein
MERQRQESARAEARRTKQLRQIDAFMKSTQAVERVAIDIHRRRMEGETFATGETLP